MTLQMLEYFIALAEKGSFTDAANACFVTQPALSRAIAGLEHELGCALVDREKRKTVGLTLAGETLLVEARRVFRQMDVMRERVRQADQQMHREISVGYIAYGILRDFRRIHDAKLQELQQQGVWIRSVYGSVKEVRERVLSGELDCALLVDSAACDMPGCRVIPVYESERRVLISSEHPFFERDSLRLADLKDSRFVFFDPGDLPLLFASNVEACRRVGFTPEVVGFGNKAGDVASLVQQYGAVSLMNTSFDFVETEELKLIPLEVDDVHQCKTVFTLVMLEEPVNPVMKHVAALFEEQDVCGEEKKDA